MLGRRVLLALCLVWLGGVAGLFAGAASAPAGSGLAGSAMVLVYGIAGAVIGAIAGALAGWKLSREALRPVLAAAVVLSLTAAIAIGVMVVRQQKARETSAAAEAASQRAPFSVSLVTHRPDSGATFIDIAIDGERDTFVMTSRQKPGRPVCRGGLNQSQHAEVLDALRRLDAMFAKETAVCAAAGEVLLTFRWTLPEGGGIAREVGLTPECDQAHTEFTALYVPIEKVAFSAENNAGRLQCDEPGAR